MKNKKFILLSTLIALIPTLNINTFACHREENLNDFTNTGDNHMQEKNLINQKILKARSKKLNKNKISSTPTLLKTKNNEINQNQFNSITPFPSQICCENDSYKYKNKRKKLKNNQETEEIYYYEPNKKQTKLLNEIYIPIIKQLAIHNGIKNQNLFQQHNKIPWNTALDSTLLDFKNDPNLTYNIIFPYYESKDANLYPKSILKNIYLYRKNVENEDLSGNSSTNSTCIEDEIHNKKEPNKNLETKNDESEKITRMKKIYKIKNDTKNKNLPTSTSTWIEDESYDKKNSDENLEIKNDESEKNTINGKNSLKIIDKNAAPTTAEAAMEIAKTKQTKKTWVLKKCENGTIIKVPRLTTKRNIRLKNFYRPKTEENDGQIANKKNDRQIINKDIREVTETNTNTVIIEKITKHKKDDMNKESKEIIKDKNKTKKNKIKKTNKIKMIQSDLKNESEENKITKIEPKNIEKQEENMNNKPKNIEKQEENMNNKPKKIVIKNEYKNQEDKIKIKKSNLKNESEKMDAIEKVMKEDMNNETKIIVIKNKYKNQKNKIKKPDEIKIKKSNLKNKSEEIDAIEKAVKEKRKKLNEYKSSNEGLDSILKTMEKKLTDYLNLGIPIKENHKKIVKYMNIKQDIKRKIEKTNKAIEDLKNKKENYEEITKKENMLKKYTSQLKEVKEKIYNIKLKTQNDSNNLKLDERTKEKIKIIQEYEKKKQEQKAAKEEIEKEIKNLKNKGNEAEIENKQKKLREYESSIKNIKKIIENYIENVTDKINNTKDLHCSCVKITNAQFYDPNEIKNYIKTYKKQKMNNDSEITKIKKEIKKLKKQKEENESLNEFLRKIKKKHEAQTKTKNLNTYFTKKQMNI